MQASPAMQQAQLIEDVKKWLKEFFMQEDGVHLALFAACLSPTFPQNLEEPIQPINNSRTLAAMMSYIRELRETLQLFWEDKETGCYKIAFATNSNPNIAKYGRALGEVMKILDPNVAQLPVNEGEIPEILEISVPKAIYDAPIPTSSTPSVHPGSSSSSTSTPALPPGRTTPPRSSGSPSSSSSSSTYPSSVVPPPPMLFWGSVETKYPATQAGAEAWLSDWFERDDFLVLFAPSVILSLPTPDTEENKQRLLVLLKMAHYKERINRCKNVLISYVQTLKVDGNDAICFDEKIMETPMANGYLEVFIRALWQLRTPTASPVSSSSSSSTYPSSFVPPPPPKLFVMGEETQYPATQAGAQDWVRDLFKRDDFLLLFAPRVFPDLRGATEREGLLFLVGNDYQQQINECRDALISYVQPFLQSNGTHTVNVGDEIPENVERYFNNLFSVLLCLSQNSAHPVSSSSTTSSTSTPGPSASSSSAPPPPSPVSRTSSSSSAPYVDPTLLGMGTSLTSAYDDPLSAASSSSTSAPHGVVPPPQMGFAQPAAAVTLKAIAIMENDFAKILSDLGQRWLELDAEKIQALSSGERLGITEKQREITGVLNMLIPLPNNAGASSFIECIQKRADIRETFFIESSGQIGGSFASQGILGFLLAYRNGSLFKTVKSEENRQYINEIAGRIQRLQKDHSSTLCTLNPGLVNQLSAVKNPIAIPLPPPPEPSLGQRFLGFFRPPAQQGAMAKKIPEVKQPKYPI